MPKLVIDDAAIQMAMEALSGQPIFAGPNGGLLEPGLIELLEEHEAEENWQPANDHSRLLVLAAEACQDIVYHSKQYGPKSERRRTRKAMAVTICSLMDVVVQLLKVSGTPEARAAREQRPANDIQTYTEASRRLRKKRMRGPVRRFRNTLGAHLDTEVLGRRLPPPTPEELFGALGDSLVLLVLSLNFDSSFFSWIRRAGQSQDKMHDVVETMFSYPVCTSWIVDHDGRVKGVGNTSVAADPRHHLQARIFSAIDSYNAMVALEGLCCPQITLSAIPEELGTEFQRKNPDDSWLSRVLLARRISHSVDE